MAGLGQVHGLGWGRLVGWVGAVEWTGLGQAQLFVVRYSDLVGQACGLYKVPAVTRSGGQGRRYVISVSNTAALVWVWPCYRATWHSLSISKAKAVPLHSLLSARHVHHKIMIVRLTFAPCPALPPPCAHPGTAAICTVRTAAPACATGQP